MFYSKQGEMTVSFSNPIPSGIKGVPEGILDELIIRSKGPVYIASKMFAEKGIVGSFVLIRSNIKFESDLVEFFPDQHQAKVDTYNMEQCGYLYDDVDIFKSILDLARKYNLKADPKPGSNMIIEPFKYSKEKDISEQMISNYFEHQGKIDRQLRFKLGESFTFDKERNNKLFLELSMVLARETGANRAQALALLDKVYEEGDLERPKALAGAYFALLALSTALGLDAKHELESILKKGLGAESADILIGFS